MTSPLDLLARGEISVKGRMPASSNATLLVEVSLAGVSTLAIYKPQRGERALWDFRPGLFVREIAAYRLSEALGWDLVPLTVPRAGPYGDGSLQLFVHADFGQHYFTLREDPGHERRLRQLCLFDVVANNADRKGGHCLLGPDGVIRAVDNGLCFHAEPKLRTVIWDFAGQAIARALLDDLARLLDTGLPDDLAALLDEDEREALIVRARTLLRRRRFPADPSGTRYPWPLV
ncbi:MAG TPA: SCO1664 family protein [Methylomirabilota bacterium]